MKFLLPFFVIFLAHCNQLIPIPKPIDMASTGDQSDADLIRISICQDADELSSCANFSASEPSDLVLCFGDFSETLSETLSEIENSDTAFSLTAEQQSSFESSKTKYANCATEIPTKVDADYIDSEEKLQEVHEDMLSCTEDFASSFKDIMKCN